MKPRETSRGRERELSTLPRVVRERERERDTPRVISSLHTFSWQSFSVCDPLSAWKVIKMTTSSVAWTCVIIAVKFFTLFDIVSSINVYEAVQQHPHLERYANYNHFLNCEFHHYLFKMSMVCKFWFAFDNWLIYYGFLGLKGHNLWFL